MDDLDSCSICIDKFDEDIRPRSLPCGHTFCTDCIQNAISGSSLSCPNCKRIHHASKATEFPINYTTEALLAKLRESQQGAISRATNTCHHPNDSRSLKSRARAVVNDQSDSLRSLLEICENVRSDIKEYKSFLRQRKCRHKDVIKEISNFLHQNETVVKQLDEEEKKFTALLKQGEEHQTMAISKRSELENITTTTDLENASEELEKIYDILDDWYHKCNTDMPCAETIRRSEKIVKEATAALCLVSKEDDEIASPSVDLSDSGLLLMDKLSLLRESPLTVKSLRSMRATTKTLLESGKIYAVQKTEGKVQSARITTQDDKIYLHSLVDEEPSTNVFTVEFSELMETLEADSVLTFLDLAWDGEIRGRIHILLSPDTPFARHFKTLCVGNLGVSYAQTTFLQIFDRGHSEHERVTAGDYENNDGSGGEPLFHGLNTSENVYNRIYKEGSVFAAYLDVDGFRSAQFMIVVGTGSGKRSAGIFGHVQDGLHVVKEAVGQADIRNVVIHDCGVVLPL